MLVNKLFVSNIIKEFSDYPTTYQVLFKAQDKNNILFPVYVYIILLFTYCFSQQNIKVQCDKCYNMYSYSVLHDHLWGIANSHVWSSYVSWKMLHVIQFKK